MHAYKQMNKRAKITQSQMEMSQTAKQGYSKKNTSINQSINQSIQKRLH